MIKVIILMMLILATESFASLGNRILIQGITTNRFQDRGYISIKDTFNQEKIYPKVWLEKLLKTKLSNREPSPVMFELSIANLNKIHADCIKVFNTDAKSKKLCPSKL